MKMTKFVKRSIALVGLVMTLILGLSLTTAQAASWHTGTPAILRGNWNSNAKTETDHGRKVIVYYSLSFTKKTVGNSATINKKTLEFRIRPVQYRKTGKHTYLIRTLFVDSQGTILNVKQINKKKIVVGTGTKNTNKETYYKTET